MLRLHRRSGLGQFDVEAISAKEAELSALRSRRVDAEKRLSRLRQGLPETAPEKPSVQSVIEKIKETPPVWLAAAGVAGLLFIRSLGKKR